MSGTIDPALPIAPESDSPGRLRAMTLVGTAAPAAVDGMSDDTAVVRVAWPDASDPRPPAAALRDIFRRQTLDPVTCTSSRDSNA